MNRKERRLFLSFVLTLLFPWTLLDYTTTLSGYIGIGTSWFASFGTTRLQENKSRETDTNVLFDTPKDILLLGY